MSKAVISIVVCLLLVLPSSSVLAGSIRKEGPIEFDLGTPYNVDHTGDRLKLNDTMDPGTWTRLSEGGPGARAYSSYGYDPKGKILLYGGSDEPQDFGNPTDTTWIYDTLNRSWHQVITYPNPGFRTLAAMTFDEKSNKYVLFGGYVGIGSSRILAQDTWVFDPSTEKWSNVSNSVHPSQRYSSAIVYDRFVKKVLFYGGTDTTKYLDDTWEFETATAKWTQLPNTNLGTQKDPHLVYVDSLGGSMITSSVNKTWLYNYTQGTWAPINNPIPQANFFAGPMVYDRETDEVVFLLWSTWIYHPTANVWEKLNPNPSPGPLLDGVIVYDNQTKTVIVQGGIEKQMGVPAYDPMPEPYMWQFDMSHRTWSRLNVTPLNKWGARIAWSSKLSSALIYGGWYGIHPDSNANFADGEIWTLSTNDKYNAIDGNNSQWFKTPSDQAIAYVVDKDSLINVGGRYSLTPPSANPCFAPMKSFDLTKRNWTTPQPVTAPSCRDYAWMDYDINVKKLVLFGGQNSWVHPYQYFNDTWSYDTSSDIWTNMSPSDAPKERAHFGMAYASKNGEFYIYGGANWTLTGMSDMWSYNLSQNRWQNVHAQNWPSAMVNIAMTYDSKRNAIVVFGGHDELNDVVDELWLYHIDTSIWEKQITIDGPSPRELSAMVYDPINDRYIIYGGGSIAGDFKCDTWAYDYTPVERSGTYTSPALNLNGTAYFGNLSWKATVTAPSELKFQVRTGNAIPEILGAIFVGPDGTAGSYYTVNNTHLNGVHNSSHYIQYIAYFKAMTDKLSPELFEVDITFNLLHSVKLTEPLVDSTIKGIKRIVWNGTDKDKDNLRYTVILRDVNGANWTLVDNTTSSSIENWDTKNYANGQYRLTVIAYDDNAAIPLMTLGNLSWFTIFNPTSSNWPPISQLLFPYDGLSVDALQTLLEWKGDDPDNDPVTFYLYISKDKDNLLKATPVVLTLKNYSFSGTAGTYYWTVIPNDGKVNGSCQSGIWSFVLGTINHAPKVKLSTPLNGTTVKEKNVTLVWNGTDEDNDPLYYFIYLSTDVELVLARSALAMVKETNLTSLFRTLEKGKYYWTVIPNDGKVNGTTTSGIWSFTIDVLGPSVTCSIASPQNNTKVKGPLEIKGTASGALGAVVRTVTVRIDGGAWSNAVGTTSWSFSIDTTKLADGPHKVEAQAQSDKGLLSKIVFIVFISRNNGMNTHVEAPYCLWMVIVIVAIIATIVVGKRYMDTRKRAL